MDAAKTNVNAIVPLCMLPPWMIKQGTHHMLFTQERAQHGRSSAMEASHVTVWLRWIFLCRALELGLAQISPIAEPA